MPISFRTALIKSLSHSRSHSLFASTLIWSWVLIAVSCSAQTPTVTQLSTTPPSGPGGSVFSLSASISASGVPVATGTVTFVDTYSGISQVLETITVQTANGTASLKRQLGGVGTHTITATFNATKTLASSSSTQTVSLSPGVNATSTGSAGSYLLTGTVSSFSPNVVPTGTFTFSDTSAGTTLISGVPLAPSTLVSPTPTNLYPTPSQPYPIAGMKIGNAAASPAFGDFNGDGKLDLVVPNNDELADGKSGLILLGNGDGTFTAGTALSSLAPSATVVGDFNGDGIQDIAIVNTGSTGSVDIYLGKGDGTFPTMTKYAESTSSDYRSIVIGDFNRDGHPDLAITNHHQGVMILLGNGDGTFQSPVTYTTGMAIGNIVVGDVNGDGFQDLAVADNGDDQVTLLLGKGDGTFRQGTYPTVPGSQSGSVALADFNGDGNLDLVVSDQVNKSVYLLLGEGNGTFPSATTVLTTTTADPYYVTIGDFNHDGHADILVVDNIGSSLDILLGRGDGTFDPPSSYTTYMAGESVPPSSYYAIVGDINGDGLDDIVTSVYGGTPLVSGLSIILSKVDVSTQPTPVSIHGCGPQMITATYSGDANSGVSSSSPISLNPSLLATSISLSTSPSSGVVGQPVTLTAVLSPFQYGTFGSDGEMVTFMNGPTSVGSAPLKGGVATLTVMSIPIGTASLTAVYSGDCALSGSSSPAVPYTVVSPLDFTFQLTSPSTVSGVYGSSGHFTFLLSPLAGTALYPGTVQFILSETGPIAATYTFSPTSVAANGGPTTVVLTVSTIKLAQLESPFGYGGLSSIGVALFLLPICSRRRFRKSRYHLARWTMIMIVLAGSLAGFAFLSGCGSGYFDHVYPIVVTATSNGVQHSITVDYHIEKSSQ